MPKKLWIRSYRSFSCIVSWNIHWPLHLGPYTNINNNINDKISPHNSKRVCTIASALRNQQKAIVTNATIRKLSFDISLGQRCNSTYNHRKCSKQNLGVPERSTPNCMPMMSPKTKNSNFRLYCNPQRHTRPCPHINIWHPEMLRSGCQLPKLSSRNKPNSESSELRRVISSSFYNLFNMRLRSFSSLPINESYSQKQLTTSKGTLQEVFHCCF